MSLSEGYCTWVVVQEDGAVGSMCTDIFEQIKVCRCKKSVCDILEITMQTSKMSRAQMRVYMKKTPQTEGSSFIVLEIERLIQGMQVFLQKVSAVCL